MTLKFENLEAICDEIKRRGYTKDVPETILETVIRIKAGLSSYVISNVKRALRETGMMKPAAIGFWMFLNPTKDLEEAEQEVQRLEEEIAEAGLLPCSQDSIDHHGIL